MEEPISIYPFSLISVSIADSPCVSPAGACVLSVTSSDTVLSSCFAAPQPVNTTSRVSSISTNVMSFFKLLFFINFIPFFFCFNLYYYQLTRSNTPGTMRFTDFACFVIFHHSYRLLFNLRSTILLSCDNGMLSSRYTNARMVYASTVRNVCDA